MFTAPQGLIPIGEAARRLGVSVETVRRFGRDGLLPEYRDARRFRYYYQEHIDALRRARAPRLVAQEADR